MDDDIRTLLEQNLRLNRENNRLLRSMKRAANIGLFFRLVWIAVLIGVPVALYVYIIQPYYEGLRDSFNQFEQQIESIPGFGTFFEENNPFDTLP